MQRSRPLAAVLAVVLAAVLLCSCEGAVGHVEAASAHAYSLLSKSDQTLYDDMTYAFAGFLPERRIPHFLGIEGDDFKRVHECVLADHPEFFYVGSVTFYKDETGVIVAYEPEYENADSAAKELSSILDKAEEIAKAAMVFTSDYDRAVYVHDYIIGACRYGGESGDKANDVRGPLLYGSATCAGYSKAFQLVLSKLDIECSFVTGDADGPHAWVAARLDGAWTEIDPTFDDPLISENEFVSHAYFGLSGKQLSRFRVYDGSCQTPKTSEMGYLERKGLFGETLAQIAGNVAAAAAANIQAGNYYFEFKSPDIEREAGSAQAVGGVIDLLKEKYGITLSRSYAYSCNLDTNTALVILNPVS